MKFLIVEDDEISSKKMRIILSAYGECTVVPDGHAAIEAFRAAWEGRSPYDVITLDIVLGATSGMDVLVSIRELERSLHLPEAKKAKIIMVTAQGARDHVITCMTAQCNGYIVKPFKKSTIAKCLREIYEQHVRQLWGIDGDAGEDVRVSADPCH